MDIVTLGLLIVGLVVLVVGAEALVRGASRLASAIGISPLVIGLTVVAFGTSSPEMAVSAISSMSGQADIALGNVVGSNIFNILFILGISAVIVPLVVHTQIIRFDVPVMIVVSLLTFVLALDGNISRIEGVILFAGIIIYTIYLIITSRRQEKAAAAAAPETVVADRSVQAIAMDVGLVAIGLVLLVLGSRWLVNGAVAIAQLFGISELVIGLTIVAAGTSLPEVATSIVAAIRGQRDIAVGNVVGSNVFNILAVLGLSSAVSGVGINVPPSAEYFDIPVMIAVALLCLPIFISGRQISRWEGWLFLSYYVLYTTYLILAEESPALLTNFVQVLWIVMPISILAVLVSLWRSRQNREILATSGD